ncbi:DUF6058 family natural product biosynthesis protein [Telluria mixta]|uniref:DUF6058 family natural product biosynthesis protein n=1 Tax=Telluria mixta TaxID=34071 RepID=A0ABT2C756_9BURK|nr:DUF6058 family natural product biosynthesis protein [Telluria mixta]MCS0633171.1 DUF6058 family natural product biosynthesis protein [Telluria mixta]WEM94657.1 DUF6058 family natural product biosynthesis protein [Telluria mixta]
MELIDYLHTHFLTRAQLLAACATDGAHLDAFIAAGTMPAPSYRLQVRIDCASYFGEHAEAHALDWYATGYVEWLRMLLEGDHDPYALFAARYRTALAALPLSGMEATDAHLRSEWQHFLAGTYGLCTRSGLPEDIAAKELAIHVIRMLTDDGRPLVAEERERLAQARGLLDRASSLFAPHERARSSRVRYGLK